MIWKFKKRGYVISIGLHLYSKLISEAKNMLLKNEKPLINEFDLDYEIPNIQLNLHLEFGDNYISEQKIKFELYKRLNLCQSLEEIESMKKQINEITPAKHTERTRVCEAPGTTR